MAGWNPLHADWHGVLKDGWRSPQILLLILAAAIPIAFEPWMVIINNFAVEKVAFTGLERGILESVREIPGFLAFTVVYLLLIWRQQTFTILALTLMGLGVALTGLPTCGLGYLFHDAPDVDRLPLPRHHGAVTLHAMVDEAGATAGAWPHGGCGVGGLASCLWSRLCRFRVPGVALLGCLPDRGESEHGARLFLLDFLSAIQSRQLPGDERGPAASLRALLRARVHVRRQAPDLRRIRGLPDSRRVWIPSGDGGGALRAQSCYRDLARTTRGPAHHQVG